MEQNEIQIGQTFQAGSEPRSPWWRIISLDTDSAYCVRTRKDGSGTWVYDEDGGRDFRLDIIHEHWTLIG